MDQKIEWQNLKAHPAADLFPRMVGSDLESLANSIKRNGQLFPIMRYKDGSVLDGRNRLAAFGLKVLSKVEPRIETYNGELSAVDYVRSVNWERMHLSQSQRTALAVLLLPEARRKAAEREKAGTLASADATVGKAAEEVAAQMGVSSRQVERAVQIQKEAPEAFEKLHTSETTVRAEHAKLPKKKKTATPRPIGKSKTNPEDGAVERTPAQLARLTGNRLEKLQQCIASMMDEVVTADAYATTDDDMDYFVDALADVQESLARLVRSIKEAGARRQRLAEILAAAR
jgi:hypothetical protein